MKKTFTFPAIAFYAMLNAQYCLPVFEYNADLDMITNVTFGSINNTSSAQSGTTSVYEDFTALSTDIQVGGNYTISVKGPSGVFPGDVVVFIDFNQDGSFNDAGESFYIGRLAEANPAHAFTITNTIAIPSNAALGTTRMRVLKNSNIAAYSDPNAPNSIHTACDATLRSGQAEDYLVNILPGNTVFPTPYCGVQNITTLTVSEISKVEFSGITQNSDINSTSPVIENFTGKVFNVNKEGSYPISVTGGTHGQASVSVYAYIDFNQNDTFETEETFNLGYLDNSNPVAGVASGITSGIITIPPAALLGQTRFRLVKAYESSSWMGTLENLPCPAGWFIGQVEDYTINILPSNLSTNELEKKSIKIYPNPVSDLIHIKTSAVLERYELYNATGQKLTDGSSDILNMSNFVPGTYLIKIQTKDKKIMTEKIIKK